MVTEVARELVPSTTQLMIGMIVWPKSKRSVSLDEAFRICKVARAADATAVGVFVDESAEQMLRAQEYAGLDRIQLHGKPCRQQYHALPPDSRKIYVVDVMPDGSYQLDVDLASSQDLLLFDSKGGGTGRSFDWDNFRPPAGVPWLLAGGVSEANVAQAVHMLTPWGIDVASGVTDASGVRKDRARLTRFLKAIFEPASAFRP